MASAPTTDPWAPSPPVPRRRTRGVRWLAAAVLGASGPVLVLLRSDQPDLAVRVASIVLLAVLAGALAGCHSSWLRVAAVLPAVAAAAVLVSTPSAARSSVVVASVATAVAVLALVPLPGFLALAPPVTTARVALGLVVAAEIAWYRRHSSTTALLLVAALVAWAVYRWSPQVAARAEAAIARATSAVTRAIAVAVVLIAAIPTLYLPGLFLTGRDRLRRRPSTTWQRREATHPEIVRGHREAFAVPSRRDRRLRYVAALCALLVLVPVTLLARGRVADTAAPSGRPITFPDYAYPDKPWVDELFAAGFGVDYHPSLGWKAAERDTRYLVEHNGVRRSWQPPEKARYTVWFLGGSALWGLGQRDDRTIPSEVARRAAAAGLPIEAVNLGVPGYTQWQEVQLLGDRLARGERPDLIVLYDGANDLTGMIYRAGAGIEPLDEPPNRFQDQVERDSHFAREQRGAKADQDDLLEAFDTVYDAGIDLAGRIAASYGVPIAFYWQPQYLSTKPSAVDAPLLADHPELAPGPGDWERTLIARAAERLPTKVVDLGDALDDAGAVTWIDPVHTNELGARLVAAELWSDLAPRVRALGPGG